MTQTTIANDGEDMENKNDTTGKGSLPEKGAEEEIRSAVKREAESNRQENNKPAGNNKQKEMPENRVKADGAKKGKPEDMLRRGKDEPGGLEQYGAKEEEPKEGGEGRPDAYEDIYKSKIDGLNSKIDELIDDLKRMAADYENLKKRSQKEKEQICAYSSAELITKLLPVADSFEHAIKDKSPGEHESKGLMHLKGQLMSILEKEGLRPIESVGKKYDPYLHEIIMQEESEMPEGTITEELQKGYMFKDKVLRHSMVKVAKQKIVK